MASIKPYKLKNGQTKYEYYISDGINKGTGKQRKIHKMGFNSYKEAEKAAKIVEGKLASGEYFRDNPKKLTLDKFLNIWINEYKNAVKEGTRIVHRNNIKTYISPHVGMFPLDQYSRTEHQKFINKLLYTKGFGRSGNGLAVKTVKSVNSTLNSAFKKAIQLGYLNENPTEYVEFPRDFKSEKEINYYTFEQSEKFLEYAKRENDPLWYPLFVLIFEQGIRKAEALGLQWKDIDFSKKKMRIERERLTAAEKGENVGSIITDDPKTAAGKRELPLSTLSFNALLAFRNHILQTFGNYPSTGNGEEFIFVQTVPRHYGNIIRDRSVNGAARRIETRADLPHIKVHDGRHTFAVRARQAGVPLEDIKDFLGHKDVSTTQIYAKITPEVKERSMSLMEEYKQELRKKHSN